MQRLESFLEISGKYTDFQRAQCSPGPRSRASLPLGAATVLALSANGRNELRHECRQNEISVGVSDSCKNWVSEGGLAALDFQSPSHPSIMNN